MTSLHGDSYSLEKIVKENNGSLQIPFAKGVIITSETNPLTFTVAENVSGVDGPDNTLTARMQFTEYTNRWFVLAYQRPYTKQLMLAPVDANNSRVLAGYPYVLTNPMVYVSGVSTMTSHAKLLRFVWASVSDESRRCLMAEQTFRDKLLASKNYLTLSTLLWLFGSQVFESCLDKFGVLLPSGSAGNIICHQIEQFSGSQRKVHILLENHTKCPEYVRISLTYKSGLLEFSETVQEYRQTKPEDTELKTLCTAGSPLTRISQNPLQLKVNQIIFVVKDEYSQAVDVDVSENEHKLLNNNPRTKFTKFTNTKLIYATIPENMRANLKIIVDRTPLFDQTLEKFQNSLAFLLPQTPTKWKRFLDPVYEQWIQCSNLHKLVLGLPSAELTDTLMKSFRNLSKIMFLATTCEEKEASEFTKFVDSLSLPDSLQSIIENK